VIVFIDLDETWQTYEKKTLDKSDCVQFSAGSQCFRPASLTVR